MKETFLIKHAVGGRTFIDTAKQPLEYNVVRDQENQDGWRITVTKAPESVVKEILAWKRELNVFVFQEFEDRPTRKIWYYVGDGMVEYDDERQQLRIAAQSRIEYVPDQFGSR